VAIPVVWTFVGAFAGAGVEDVVGVELDGALAPTDAPPVEASALPAGAIAQAIPAIRASRTVVLWQSIRIVFGAYGVS
jgi:stage V sporulation protein SpoVS